MPTCWRSLFTSTPGPETRSFASRISPPWIFSSPLTQRRRVDLPQPDGPIRQTTWCSFTSRLMPRSTRIDPNSFSTLFISRNAKSAPCPGTGIVTLNELVDKASLRNGNQHEEDCHDCDGREIESIGGNNTRLVEGVDDAYHLHKGCVLLQSDEIIEQRRHDAAHSLRHYDIAHRLHIGEAKRT